MQFNMYYDWDKADLSSGTACWSQYGTASVWLKALMTGWLHQKTALVYINMILSTCLQLYSIV